MLTGGRLRVAGEPEPRLGLLNGALIGLALALGAWGLGLFAVETLSPLWYGSHLLGMAGVILLAGLAGWLAALSGKAFINLIIWTAAGLGMTWIVGHQAYEGSTLMAWLLDRRFWGLAVYPYIPAALVRQAMAGFFVVLLLAILGLLQPYRLEGISNALTATRRLTGYAWLLLLLPLPLMFGAGLIADNLVNRPLRSAITVVNEVFRSGRTYEGDLFQLSLERGINYNAIAGIRQQMGPNYTLSIGEIDLGAAATVFVVAHFENGAWINCRVMAEQLSFCWDASPPYKRGLPALLAGQQVTGCPECTVVVDAAAQAHLKEAQTQFGEPPAVRWLAQQGSYVWLRAESPTGDLAVDCLLQGISPVRLVECRPASAPAGDATTGQNVTQSAGLWALHQPQFSRTPGLMALAPPEPETPLGMATPDRMAPPPTVYPPAQADLGAQVYWFKCMVCHGDRGQGLTEDWRAAWDPSHQDCWQSRCHASNHPPEGFQFPYYAPPVIGPGTLARHTTLANLHDYLAGQMPWQAPGSLPAEEYWQLAAYLARANGAAVSDADLNLDAAARVLLHQEAPAASPTAEAKVRVAVWPLLVAVMLPLGLWALVSSRRKRR